MAVNRFIESQLVREGITIPEGDSLKPAPQPRSQKL